MARPAVDATTHDVRLHGVFCTNAEEAVAAAADGADFLGSARYACGRGAGRLCDSVPMPVFARGIGSTGAWALGRVGLNELEGSGFDPD